MTMNPEIKKKIRAKAIKAYNEQQFGCEDMEFIKAYNVETRKPVTLFVFKHEWGTLIQDRIHPNEMVQNVEHNGHRAGLEKFIKEFIVEEAIEYRVQKKILKAKKKKKEAQANTLANLCPELKGLRLA